MYILPCVVGRLFGNCFGLPFSMYLAKWTLACSLVVFKMFFSTLYKQLVSSWSMSLTMFCSTRGSLLGSSCALLSSRTSTIAAGCACACACACARACACASASSFCFFSISSSKANFSSIIFWRFSNSNFSACLVASSSFSRS